MTPHEALAAALDQLTERGESTPCAADPERWIGDDPTARAFAALECVGACPLLTECRSAGRFEQWGIWGGVDRSKTTRRKKAA